MSFQTVDDYIASYSPEIQAILHEVRSTIKSAVPESGETIRYQMPCATIGDDYLIHYAAWSKHIGLYPVPVFESDLEAEVAPLRSAKDTVQLMYVDPLPTDLLTRIVQLIASRR
ncbi:uncharacterized protein YdhG (YjbR/CyaY superfamily) [Aeromicrobium panaciterrae]|uniref:Uncharacterized protein YdhG (YjbR/CyaY superfamily) n=1 Tax=Aeromicrobium panaciterrae TaxID=363861 RepID=A0ABU1UPW6_9ACTN|nr:DUF1801 domain-containing protein [Aeromicrobium panaciterrae]MDR7087214.1 uncharacterized protein YdhG (YjbR/CyaY superfamily) [Aeromicrobium panaciterrae]